MFPPGTCPCVALFPSVPSTMQTLRLFTLPLLVPAVLAAQGGATIGRTGTEMGAVRGGRSVAVAEVRANPQCPTDAATCAAYDRFTSQVEGEPTRMHDAVTEAHAVRAQLAALLAGLPTDARHAEVRRHAETR